MINKLILGTVQLGIPYGVNNSAGQPGPEEACDILDRAATAGITLLDTAKAYGSSMEVIGSYHFRSPFRFGVISKFHSGQPDLLNIIKNELSVLNVDYFEGYLFHAFKDLQQISPETSMILQDLKQLKLVRKVGVSVYGNEEFEQAIHDDLPDIIQLPYNMLDNDRQRGTLIELAKQKGKEIHVRSVFLQGLFFMEPALIPKKIKALSPFLSHIREIAVAEGFSVHELALAYVLRNTLIDKILIGVDSVSQLDLNLKAVEKASVLSQSAIDTINLIQVNETGLLSPVNWN